MPHDSDTDVLSVQTQCWLVFYRETGPSVLIECVHQRQQLSHKSAHIVFCQVTISLQATLFALHFTAAIDSGGVWGGGWGGCLSLEKLFRPSVRVGMGWSFFFYFSVFHLWNTSMSVSSPGRLHTTTVWKTTCRSNTIPFPFTPPTLGGKLQSRLLCLISLASVNLLRSNQREIIVYAVHVFFPFLVFPHHSCQR